MFKNSIAFRYIMDLYFLTVDDLDQPIHKVDTNVLFNNIPFYNDFYVVLYLKKIDEIYVPIFINDRELIVGWAGGQQFPKLITSIIASGEKILFHNYKIIYRIVVFNNGWWCAYVEKRHIWNPFQSLGVTLILSKNKGDLIDFFQQYFTPNLIKTASKKHKN